MAAGTQVASLFAKISADASGFKREMGSARNELDAFGKASSAIGTGLKLAAGVGIAAVGALATGFGIAIKAAGGLEQQAANISAVFGSMAPPVKEVKDLISKLSLDPTLVVGVEDAGAGLEMLAKNGLTWEQISGGAARSTILLANATGTDLATSADIATNAMSIFGLGVEDLDGVVSTFVNSANASQFGVEDFGYALANAGPTAAQFGIKMEDLFAAMTMTSGSFSSGMQMGTSWGWMIKGLVPNTDKAKDAMKELGLITADGANQFFNADGTGKSLSEILKLLQGSFGKLSTEQQMAYSRTIFGGEAFGALSSAINLNLDELGALIPTMRDFSAVEAGAKTRTNTFSAAMSAMGDTIQSLITQIGDKFLPIVTKMARGFTEFMSSKGARITDWFERLAYNLQNFIDYIVVAWTSGDPLGVLFESFRKLWNLIMTGNFEGGIFGQTEDSPIIGFFLKLHEILNMTVLGVIKVKDVLMALGVLLGVTIVRAVAAWIASMWPVVLVFAAIVAAVVAFRLAWENNWGGIQEKTRAVLDWLQMRFGPLLDTIRQFGGEALQEIIAFVTGTGNEFSALSTIWDKVKETFGLVWQDIRGVLDAWGAKIKEWANIAWEWLGKNFPQTAEALKKAWEGIKESWDELWGVLKPLIDKAIVWWGDLVTAWQTGSTDMGGAINALKTVFDFVWSTMVTLGSTALQTIIDTAKLLLQIFTGDWSGAWQTIQDIFGRVWDAVKTIFGNAVTAIDLIFGTTLGQWEGDWGTAWEAIKGVTATIWNAISGVVSGAMASIAAFLSPYLESWGAKIKGWAEDAWAWFGVHFPKTAKSLIDAWNIIKAAFGELWGVIAPIIKRLSGEHEAMVSQWEKRSVDWSAVWTRAAKFLDSILSAIVTAIGGIVTILARTITLLIQLIDGDWKGAWETWRKIVYGACDAIKKIFNDLVDALDALFGTDLRQLATDMFNWGRNMVQGLWNGITEKWNQFKTWWDGVWGGLQTGLGRMWEEHSPSQWMFRFGEGMMEGLSGGIESGVGKVTSIIDKLNQDVQSGLIKSFEVFEDNTYRILQLSGNITKGVIENGKLMMKGWEEATKAVTTIPVGGKAAGSGPTAAELMPSTPGGKYNISTQVGTIASLFGAAKNALFDTFVGDFFDALKGQSLSASQAQAVNSAAATVGLSETVGLNDNYTVDKLLTALNVLVATLQQRGMGSQFNVNMAPTGTGNSAADLRATVEYLQALYA